MNWTSVALSLLVGGLGSILYAEEVPMHDITIEDYFTQANLFEAIPSPTGEHVAYTDARWQESSNDRKSDLWVVTSTNPKMRRLTHDRLGARSVSWGPTGKTIYFLANSKREGEKQPPWDGSTQVWKVSTTGENLPAVTRFSGGVQNYQLANDGRTLFYTIRKKVNDEAWQALRKQFGDIDYGHGQRNVSELWQLDLVSWRTSKLYAEEKHIHEFSVSPNGRHIAMITAKDDKVITFEGQSNVELLNVTTGKAQTLEDDLWRKEAPSPYGWLDHLAWSGSSSFFAFNIVFDAQPSEVIVVECQEDEPTSHRLARPEGVSLRGYGSPLGWRGEELVFLAEQKARVRVCGIPWKGDGKQGDARILTPGDVVVENMQTANNQVAVILGTPTRLPDVYLVVGEAKPQKLTHVNPQADTWKFPKMSVVTWKGANGDDVEGVLELPPDYKEGERVPLVVAIHGGPTTASRYYLQFWIYGRVLLPAKGYAVLSPNYRGSTGYGDKFLTDLVGHENERDVQDILTGVDALIDRGIADPKRLGVMGWSNGGYLTNCIISKTTRFKAASSGASIVDTVMEWGSNDEPAYAISFKQGFPWNQAETYQRTSSTYALDKIRTPTLIHVGANDERCPPSHSRMLYRALHEYVKVPTELLVYPGEPHGLSKFKNRQAKMAWDLAWFDRYILGK